MEIKITVEVENADELLILHKGGIFGFFADVVLSKSKKQYKVELKVELPLRLEEEQVRTKLNFEIADQQNSSGASEI